MYTYFLDDKQYGTFQSLRNAVIAKKPHISFPIAEDKFLALNWSKWGISVRREEIIPPEPTIDMLKARKKDEITNARYNEETNGYMYDNHRIATDDRSKSLLLACVVASQLAEDYSVEWKCEDGEYITLNKNRLLELSAGLTGWVEQLFAKEKRLLEEVNEATTAEEIEQIRW